MGSKSNKIIGTRDRINLRSVFETDYDRTNPPTISDEKNEYRAAQKRDVRFWVKKCPKGYRATVVGPFFSALYGVNGFGTTHRRAEAALKRALLRTHNYIGRLVGTDKDDADNVGLSVSEKWHKANNAEREVMRTLSANPITMAEAVGSAGM